jgi:triphosphatase
MVPAADLDLTLPPDQAARLTRLPVLAAHRAGRTRSVAIEMIWHDTAEGALAAAGLALCEHRLGRARRWRLLALHASPPGAAATLRAEADAPAALGHPLPAPLLPVAACTGRLRTLALDPDTGAVLSLLEGRLRAASGEQPVCRLRLEGAADPGLALALAEATAAMAAPDTLAVAALTLAGRAVPAPVPPALAEGQRVSEAFACLLARQAAVLLRLAPDAAAGNGTEPVHQMRVALRRLRSALKLFRRAVDGPAIQSLLPELRALSAVLGPARDWDVFLAETGAAVGAAFPAERAVARLLAAAAHRRAAAYTALAAHLHGPGFRALTIRLAWLAAARPWEAEAGPDQEALLAKPLAAFAARALDRRLASLLAPGPDLSGLSAEALHALRIEAKRLRYAAEFFAPLYPPRPVRRLVRRVSVLQDRLGRLNDATVAAGLLETLGGSGRGFAAGAVRGFIAADHAGSTTKVDRAWRRVRRLEPFWD